MNYKISKPSGTLSGYVKHFWAMENCMPRGNVHVQRIVPNGLFELIFYLGDKPEPVDTNKSISEKTVITGQLKEYYDLTIRGDLSLFSIIFQPHGLSIFFDLPLSELYNQNVPLRFLIKNAVDELESKLLEADTFSSRIEIVENFLIHRLVKSRKKYHLSRIKSSIDTINREKGLVSIDHLAYEACLSRKQYERIFSELIGTTPKQFLKIVRFQSTIHEKSISTALSLTELSYQCGYYDQSHMVNEFSKLSGMTPSQYFKDCEPYSDYFQ